MPTILTHPIAAFSLGRLLTRVPRTRRFWATMAVCACLPDADVAGFFFGVRYGDLLGHRGLSHSLPFALFVGLVAALLHRDPPRFSAPWWRLAGLFFVATFSHDVLDALTDGGLGVAFFSPLDNTRYFFPFRPLPVSPIGLSAFLSPLGVRVLAAEFQWIWLPSLALLIALSARKRHAGPRNGGGE